MKRFHSYVIRVVLVCLLLAGGHAPVRADMFGAGDAALLLQQVLQYVQDFDLDDARWADIIDKVNRAKEISDAVMKGKKGYDALNSVYTATKQVLNTCNDMSKYVDYVGEFGSEWQWRRCGTIYNNYERRTASLIESMGKTLSLLSSADSENPHQLLSSLNEAAETFSNSLEKFDREAVSDMVDVCREVAISESVESNKDFYNLSVC